jgi:hypothetical protein
MLQFSVQSVPEDVIGVVIRGGVREVRERYRERKIDKEVVEVRTCTQL